MKKTRHSILFIAMVLVGLLAIISSASAADMQAINHEINGDSLSPSISPVRSAQAKAKARSALPTSGLLLIPETTNDRVMAFDPTTGDLIDADFIPSDPTNLATPINAILGSDNNSILVSDQINDAVLKYDLDGNFIGLFAPASGVDTLILDNVRGISLHTNGNLLVTVGGGANADSVAQFDTNGVYVGNFIASSAGGLDSPFDILDRGSDFLVGGINSDMIHRYDQAGSPITNFSGINTFPEQIALAGNGNILVGNFSGTQEGVVEFSPDGSSVVGIYNPATLGGYRGVYELPNGNLLTTTESGVHEIDRAGNLVETKISGVSARFIEFVRADQSAIPTLNEWGMIVLILLLAASGILAKNGIRTT